MVETKNWYWKEFYSDWSIRFEWEYENWVWKKWKRYNPSWITYDWEFNDEWQKHGHWKWIRDWVLYYDWDFFEDEIQWKWKLYDENWVLAYEWDFFEARREWHGKYYEDWKLIYEWERKDWIPLTPREWYDQEKEDKRYEDDLCWRFWGMWTALLEHRKGTIWLW